MRTSPLKQPILLQAPHKTCMLMSYFGHPIERGEFCTPHRGAVDPTLCFRLSRWRAALSECKDLQEDMQEMRGFGFA